MKRRVGSLNVVGGVNETVSGEGVATVCNVDVCVCQMVGWLVGFKLLKLATACS